MFKKICLTAVVAMFISLSCGLAYGLEQSGARSLELQYVEPGGWNQEYLCAELPMTEEEFDSVHQMLVYYSLDGESWQPVVHPRLGGTWDLAADYSTGEIGQSVYTGVCMNTATEPFKQFLAGDIDCFQVKLCIISGESEAYTAAACLQRSSECLDIPDYCTAVASYHSSITRMMKDEDGTRYLAAVQEVEIVKGTAEEQILSALPDSYDMQVNVVAKEGFAPFGQLKLSYALNWNIPDCPEKLEPGTYTVKSGNEAIPPDGNFIFKKGLSCYYVAAPPAEIPLYLVITVKGSDEAAEAPVLPQPPDNGDSDDDYGSGGNRGNAGSIGSGEASVLPQPSDNENSGNDHINGENRGSAGSGSSDSESEAQERISENEAARAVAPGPSQIEDFNVAYNDTGKLSDGGEGDHGSDGNADAQNRKSGASLKYIIFIFAAAAAIAACMALFIFWRRSRLRI